MPTWNDVRMEKVISVLLRSGVVLAAAVAFVGGACFLWQHADNPVHYHQFQPAPKMYRSILGVLHAAGPSDCKAVIQLGLLLLIATPIARVGFSIAGFALEHDWTYVWLTAIVFVILIYSVAAGR